MRKSFQKPSPAAAVSNVGAKCQKCLKEDHWTADCTNERVYKPRPSRTALLFNPKLKLPEANLVKDDFVDERLKKQIKQETEVDNEEINEIPDSDTFANQLIEEVKMTQKIHEGQFLEGGNHESKIKRSDTRDYNSGRRRSHSPVHSRSRSKSRSRSPYSRKRIYRSRSRTPEAVKSIHKKEKKISEYASDSDFSSDSD